MLRDNTDGIFSYTVQVTDYEKTDEETGETRTIHHYEYTVEYAGDSYYAENVFHLTDEQIRTAEDTLPTCTCFYLTRFIWWKSTLT